jgi:hypothetical protein
MNCNRTFQRATDGRQHSRQFGPRHSCELKRVVNVNYRRTGNILKPRYPTAQEKIEYQQKEKERKEREKEEKKVRDQEERRKGRTDILGGILSFTPEELDYFDDIEFN